MEALDEASSAIRPCPQCGHICEGELCVVCSDPRRDAAQLCFVEQVPDLAAIERSGAYRGRYHVLHGKLSPLHGIGPEDLNLAKLEARFDAGEVEEIILALSNDIEGEATCHYLQETYFAGRGLKISRIGFGLPSGGGIVFADATTLKSALEGRRQFE
jgi:recombination protein RecR